MIKTEPPTLETLPTVKDSTEVWVRDGDIERAVKELRRRVLASGVLRLLAIRRSCPKRSDREKVKQRRAASHRKRWAARQAASDLKDTR